MEMGHEYKEELVISAKRAFEKLCLGADKPMQTPAFNRDNQDPFLDTECRIQELHFAIRNLRVRSSPGQDRIRSLAGETLENLLEIHNDI